MNGVSQLVRESTFTPENVSRLESKLFFDGVKRRRQLEQFSVLLFLAAIIATMGVLGDSTATVIGAMIISPLMTPIMATAAALVMGQMRLRRAALHPLPFLRDVDAGSAPDPPHPEPGRYGHGRSRSRRAAQQRRHPAPIYGNMTFAGAETVEAQLPQAKDSERPVVILRLRAQDGIGSSFLSVLERYETQLKAHGGKLMVAGVNPKVKGQLDRTEISSEILGAENVFVSTTTLGESSRAAYAAAQRWLQKTAGQQPEA